MSRNFSVNCEINISYPTMGLGMTYFGKAYVNKGRIDRVTVLCTLMLRYYLQLQS